MNKKKWLKRSLYMLTCSFLLFSNTDVKAVETIGTTKNSNVENNQSFEQFAQGLTELCTKDAPYFNKIIFDSAKQKCVKDGLPVEAGQQNRTKMKKKNNNNMVSAELLAQAIGGQLSISDDSQIATIEQEGERVSVSVGDGVLVSTNEIRQLDENPYIEEGCMMLPLEDIVQALGMNVSETETGETVVTDEFQTMRLIVKSSEEIMDDTATEIIEGYDNLHILQYASREDAMYAYERFQGMDKIEYVQTDGVYSLSDTVSQDTTGSGLVMETSSSTYHSWGVEKMNMDSYQRYLEENYSTLPQIVVAVLDTGIDYSNSFFSQRIADNGANYATSSGPGWPGSTSTTTTAQDDNGHGTAVSGIIAESTLSNVTIMPVKVLNQDGSGTDSTVYMGLNYAIQQGVDVINMSLGGDGTSDLYEDIVQEAATNGIPVVVAAGNESKDATQVTPANVKEAITVSSVNSSNAFSSSFSNYGSNIDITAPGEAIEVVSLSGGFKTGSGTSFSTPHITAAVALLKSANYYLDTDSIISRLENSTIDLGSTGWDQYFGYGLLSLSKAESYFGVEGALSFNTEPGNYDESISLKLLTDDSSAQIFYTTDGTEPSSENGVLYTNPITIDTTTQIKAIAYLDGIRWSSIISGKFNIGSDDGEYTINDGVKGDVDSDNEVTAADALTILRYIAEIETLNEAQLTVANVDGSGSITASDALMILKYVAQITSAL